MLMESIYDVAKCFLSKEPMSHKKLQKMCYFSQAWYLLNYKECLVPNRFEAWAHDSVSPDLYSKYRDWGWENIPLYRNEVVFEDEGTASFLDKVYKVYGDYDADELEKITRREKPWKNARKGLPSGAYSRNPILLNDMRDYYGERIGKA